jgi:NAD-dependent DNA ligase
MTTLREIMNRRSISDRQINELSGLSHGLLADGKITQDEAEYLQKWFAANEAALSNPLFKGLISRLDEMLSDQILSNDESKELFETLESFVGGSFELGELLKSTNLPLTDPKPEIEFESKSFCFTGTFLFGKRKECEGAVIERGGAISTLRKDLNYLVIGIYATESWAHSSFGRKIEKAVSFNDKGADIKIISEADWIEAI